MQYYLNRFSELTGNNLNCGPILNWLEVSQNKKLLMSAENRMTVISFADGLSTDFWVGFSN